MIITIEDCKAEMLKDLTTGQEKGTTTYYGDFDNAWSWKKGEVNIWSGYANEGKSLFIKQLCLIKALAEDKKFVFCSPEDYPPKSFYDDLIHTLSGKTTDIGKYGAITVPEYEKCMEIIKDSIVFLHLKYPNNSIPDVLKEVEEYHKQNEVFGLIIDPIMKFSRTPEAPIRDDLYAGYLTTLLTEFAREHNISLHLVMHQLTPRKEDNGLYPKPSMYQVKSGGSFADGVDNLLFVWRPNYAKDKLDPSVTIGSLKVKKQKLVGIPQDFTILFDRKTNRYINGNNKPIFDFDRYKLK